MDDRLRSLARAARDEVESGLDLDAELRSLDGRTASERIVPRVSADRERRGVTVWLAAAAAAAVALVGGVWLLGDDDAIQIAEPETTLAPETTVALAPTSTVTASTNVPSTTEPGAASPGTCTDVSPDESGIETVARSVVEARVDGGPPSVAGCLDTIPAVFDGSPSRCWSCAGQSIGHGMTGNGQSATGGVGFTFSLFVSTPAEGAVIDVVETWSFQLDRSRDVLSFGGVEFDEPLVSRADSLATIDEYLAAIESGEWLAAARMLDDGAVNPDERADLRRLELDDYSYESVAAALEAWCATGCWTERPTAADLEFNGYAHSLTRFGERITVVWYEGYLSIDGLPPRLPVETDVETVAWRELTWEGTSIGRSCLDEVPVCTRVIHDPDGTPISYDPVARELTRHDRPEVSVTLPEEYGERPWLYHAGPDGVVYLQVAPATPAELAADVVALTLSDDDAGREIGRWSGVVDDVGDSELIATRDGLVNVNCCGGAIRPEPDAEVLVPWLDRDGEQVTSPAATISVEIEYPRLTVRRPDPFSGGTRSWTYEPAGEWLPRGMPRVVPTFDGGFLAAEHGTTGTSIARGFANGTVEQLVLDSSVLLVDSIDLAGRLLIADDERFVRVDPFPDRVPRPADQASIDVEAGTVNMPDLSGITADWLFDPVAFTDAVRGPLAVNERRAIDAEQLSDTRWLVTVTTSNFFDDSVFADRWALTLERADDGRLSFVSSTWANSCQPGRGHQDFQAELCV